MAVEPFDNYLDLVDAARILGIHPQSLRRLIKQKKVPAVLFAGKYLIQRDKLEMPRQTFDGHFANVIPAERILERGARERPDDWQIAFVLGYLQAFDLGEPERAAGRY